MKCTYDLQGHSAGSIGHIRYSSDGEHIAVCSGSQMQLFGGGRLLQRYQSHGRAVRFSLRYFTWKFYDVVFIFV